MKKRNAWISGLCALIEPGLGLAYNGKFILAIHVTLVSWGIQTALLFLGVFRSFYLVLAVLTATLAFRISMVAVCVNQARQLAVVSLSRYNRWYIYGLFLATSFIFGSALEQSKASLPHRTFYDPTNSMEPAVREGDYLVADMRFYGSHPLLPGDVVIFRPPIDTTTVCVKRCVAINGHKVQIRDGILYVNDERFLPSLRTKRLSPNILGPDFQDRYIRPVGAGNGDQYGPVVVPKGMCFLIGDLRDNSLDSRYFGFVPNEDVLGKLLYVYWSKDFERIGKDVK